MSGFDGGIFDFLGILAVLLLVAANGFFVAAEFSLVSVRRSRVTELVAEGRMNATALQRAVDNLDANLAATPARHHHIFACARLGRGTGARPSSGAASQFSARLLGRCRIARRSCRDFLRHHYGPAHRSRRTCTEEPGVAAQRRHRFGCRAAAGLVPVPAPPRDHGAERPRKYGPAALRPAAGCRRRLTAFACGNQTAGRRKPGGGACWNRRSRSWSNVSSTSATAMSPIS